MSFTEHAAIRVVGSIGSTVALVLSLAACGVSSVSGGSESTSTQAPAFTAATSGELHIYTWSDYFPESALKAFTKETGIKTTIDYYQNNEELISKLEVAGTSGYDVVVPSGYAVKEMISKGLLMKFDAQDLPNGKYISTAGRHPYFDKNREYSAPYLYGVTGYMYDSSKLSKGEKAPTTWKDYFTSSAAWSATPGIHDDQNDGVNAALLATGGTPCTSSAKELQAASDLLMSFKQRVKNISSNGTLDRLVSGENSDSMIWNGYGHRAAAENKNLTWVYPKEGALMYQDNWSIPSGAKNVQQAMTFINWMMKPKNSLRAVEYNNYNSYIDGVEELMPDDLKNDSAIITPSDVKLMDVPQCSTDVVNKYSQIWEQFKE